MREVRMFLPRRFMRLHGGTAQGLADHIAALPDTSLIRYDACVCHTYVSPGYTGIIIASPEPEFSWRPDADPDRLCLTRIAHLARGTPSAGFIVAGGMLAYRRLEGIPNVVVTRPLNGAYDHVAAIATALHLPSASAAVGFSRS